MYHLFYIQSATLVRATKYACLDRAAKYVCLVRATRYMFRQGYQVCMSRTLCQFFVDDKTIFTYITNFY